MADDDDDGDDGGRGFGCGEGRYVELSRNPEKEE